MPRKKKPSTTATATADPPAEQQIDLAAEIRRRNDGWRPGKKDRPDGPVWFNYADLLRTEHLADDDLMALADVALELGLEPETVELHHQVIRAEAEATAAARDLTAARRAIEDTGEWWRECWRRQSEELARHRREVGQHEERRRDDHLREQAALDAEHARGSIRRAFPRLFGLDPAEHQVHPGDILPGDLRNMIRDIEEARR